MEASALNGDNYQRQDDINRAADVIASHDESWRHRHPHSDQSSGANTLQAQSSHALMGSGRRELRHNENRLLKRPLEKGEVFEKIHSGVFFLLAALASAVDYVWNMFQQFATRVWGQPIAIPSMSASKQLQHESAQKKKYDDEPIMATDNAPAGAQALERLEQSARSAEL